MDEQADLLSSTEAARRLGVKPKTLYAYVSRGLVRRERSEDGRRSWFDPAEVERLARRGRQSARSEHPRLAVDSAVTSVQGGRLRYRGLEAVALAAGRRFEEVAHWLWTGTFPQQADWWAEPRGLAVGRSAQAVLPADTLPLGRLRVIAAALAATLGAAGELRLQLDPPAVVDAAQSLVASLVGCLPDAQAAVPTVPRRGAGIAERLWRKLTPAEPEPSLLRALDAALVLLADHEPTASTTAVRAAASVRADPYAVVSAGLAAAGGALHTRASLDIDALLAEAGRPARAARAVGERLRRGERIRGFGHFLYPAGDPRAAFLLERLSAAAAETERPAVAEQLAVAEAVLSAARRRHLPAPNVDFALATLARMAGMIPGAGEAVFVTARTAGWLAHAIDAYQTGPAAR